MLLGCILIWLGVAATLVLPYLHYEFTSAFLPIRIYQSVFISLCWPFVLFLLIRKQFLTATILWYRNA